MRIQWCRCKVILHTPWNGQLLDVKFESRQMPKAITTNMVPLSKQNVKLIFLGNHLRLPTCIVFRQDATWRFTKYILFLILQTTLMLLELIQNKNSVNYLIERIFFAMVILGWIMRSNYVTKHNMHTDMQLANLIAFMNFPLF